MTTVTDTQPALPQGNVRLLQSQTVPPLLAPTEHYRYAGREQGARDVAERGQ